MIVSKDWDRGQMLLVEFLSLFVPSAQGINHHIFFFNCSFLESTIFPGINQICYFIQRFHVMSSCSFWKVSSFLSHQMISSVARIVANSLRWEYCWRKEYPVLCFMPDILTLSIFFFKNASERADTYVFISCQRFSPSTHLC